MTLTELRDLAMQATGLPYVHLSAELSDEFGVHIQLRTEEPLKVRYVEEGEVEKGEVESPVDLDELSDGSVPQGVIIAQATGPDLEQAIVKTRAELRIMQLRAHMGTRREV